MKAKLPLLVRKLVTDNAVKRGLSVSGRKSKKRSSRRWPIRRTVFRAAVQAVADVARRWNGWPGT
ncbi:MAG: hypothetical protein ACLVJB_01675 [Christensenellales bacterium]